MANAISQRPPRSWEPGVGNANWRWAAAAASAFMAGTVAPDVAVDFVNYAQNVLAPNPPLAQAHLPADFTPKAIAAGAFSFTTAWFTYFAVQAGKQPRHGAPVEAAES
ncbi:MAG: hypothetical protein RMA76_16680 [Deltaproteobacteria bacterium]|jgi:hypothetical protein